MHPKQRRGSLLRSELWRLLRATIAHSGTVQHFTRIRDRSLQLLAKCNGNSATELNVADIGCGPGTQAQLWAERGHKVFGLDVNAPLIEIARQRAEDAGLSINYDIGSATELPYPDASMDVALLPELEHVPDGKAVSTRRIPP